MDSRRHPIRTCLVCQTRSPKPTLLRLVVDPATAEIAVDARQQAHGRGGYVCPQCLSRLKFSNRVRKAFRNRAGGIAEAVERGSSGSLP